MKGVNYATETKDRKREMQNAESEGGRYLGEIAPQYGGRWSWPFRHMKPGDWFQVDHNDREPEDVRNMAMVRGSQLGKGFSVAKQDPERPGFTRVTCVPYGGRDAPKAERMNYELAQSRFMLWFGLDLDQVPPFLSETKPVIVEPLGEDEDAPERMVFLRGNDTVGVEQVDGKLHFYLLPHAWTLAVWEKFYGRWKAKLKPVEPAAVDEPDWEERLLVKLREEQLVPEQFKDIAAKTKLAELKRDPAAYEAALNALRIEALLD